ncbi:CMRF35-like molecule 7 [Tachysurus fulvidraco]|uniref:CMRF35-like molecule 7 n=1 Tax=Tachysurus fulvidraco TaxID=1234273 RepID=UPI001FEEE6BC|nr:CMRF35-like molecule 7 [Tachysurus fulvidraco]
MMLVLLLFLEKVAGVNALTGPSEVKQCAGGSVHIVCQYHPFYRDNVKYWCKGYYFNYCTILVQTSQSQDVYGSLQITDNKRERFFTIHMKNAQTEDSGWYWCAIKRVSRHVSKAMQLIISDEEAQHCAASRDTPHNIQEVTIRPQTSALTTFRSTTITSTSYVTRLKTTDLTETKHESVPVEIYVTERSVHKIWSIARWILFTGMCLYLSCFITCFEIWFRR